MFSYRSHKKELLDGPVERKELFQNLKELHSINSLLGGYRISIDAIKKFNLNGKTLVDIGSGGGDTLHQIHKYIHKNSINSKLIGIDLKLECTEYAQSHLPAELTFITDDYRNISLHTKKIDFIHACLFTHHLTEEEIIELITFALNNNAVLIINDLERNPIAYYAIKVLTRLFSKSHLVKNDAPLSVLRGFKKAEWLKMIQKTNAKQYNVTWKWAFRHQIIIDG
ncbi:MAG: methyltransferase domain-containing protein [Bacteroidia bacterium]